MNWVRGVWTSQDQRSVAEFIDAVFGLVFAKTGSINSGTEEQTMASKSKMVVMD